MRKLWNILVGLFKGKNQRVFTDDEIRRAVCLNGFKAMRKD